MSSYKYSIEDDPVTDSDEKISHVTNVKNLIELLNVVPDNYVIVPNQVANLTILDEERNFAGYIELGPEKMITLFDFSGD